MKDFSTRWPKGIDREAPKGWVRQSLKDSPKPWKADIDVIGRDKEGLSRIQRYLSRKTIIATAGLIEETFRRSREQTEQRERALGLFPGMGLSLSTMPGIRRVSRRSLKSPQDGLE